LVLKIIFKNKIKYYFNIFSNKKYFKKLSTKKPLELGYSKVIKFL